MRFSQGSKEGPRSGYFFAKRPLRRRGRWQRRGRRRGRQRGWQVFSKKPLGPQRRCQRRQRRWGGGGWKWEWKNKLLSAPFLTPAETKILVPLSVLVKRFFVSRMLDFCKINWKGIGPISGIWKKVKTNSLQDILKKIGPCNFIYFFRILSVPVDSVTIFWRS